MKENLNIGVAIICRVCGLPKKPIGRDAGLMADSYCDDDCPGYRLAPYPSDLWPGETREEFGYGGVR